MQWVRKKHYDRNQLVSVRDLSMDAIVTLTISHHTERTKQSYKTRPVIKEKKQFKRKIQNINKRMLRKKKKKNKHKDKIMKVLDNETLINERDDERSYLRETERSSVIKVQFIRRRSINNIKKSCDKKID